jgi:hypothetical protein
MFGRVTAVDTTIGEGVVTSTWRCLCATDSSEERRSDA